MSRNSTPNAVIFGCAGANLTAEERRFFARANPFGFILFARNIFNLAQVCALVDELRATVLRGAPVLIDQEGGRVQRLKPPHWKKRPPMAQFAKLAADDLPAARRAVRANSRLIAHDLAELGIDVDCAPVLDVPVAGSHDIIGDRAFGDDPLLIADLGRASMDGLLDGGVMPVVKHCPGHGRARVDSHSELPVVDSDRETMERSDFVPFRSLRDAPWAMTAHVVYTAIDATRPATLSPLVVQSVIRDAIGFDGLLLTDDLSMGALKGSLEERARLSLAAGCDVALHCNGNKVEMESVLKGVEPLSEAALDRVANAKAMLRRKPLSGGEQALVDTVLAGSAS